MERLKGLLQVEPVGDTGFVPDDIAKRWDAVHDPQVGLGYGLRGPDGGYIALVQRHLDGGWTIVALSPDYAHAVSLGNGPAPLRTATSLAERRLRELGWGAGLFTAG